MKVYLEEKDIGRRITTYHDGLGTQQGLYVFGKDKIEILSLADYTKQVKKEVCEEIRSFIEKPENSIYWDCSIYVETEELIKFLDQIQGETKC